ncbi:bifunctional diguanylate cyclase/phosphodiesterase [Paraburkholderia dipogonis]|uniref:Bifunctional diguanylate cyclase/phosphodiesterase n=2 Tax=Paraburkholderia dipogonis TaxID=1211383 RepID=A0A4Y8MRM7_9BURK|nr:bifunctional diguanylate cyclase/phosphodiesterase [Paraburkholderia dipogonis]TFE40072.1 bifunctional diguanylate cyclase/phosphodiesterase [Paraburkholderia dipogonis]
MTRRATIARVKASLPELAASIPLGDAAFNMRCTVSSEQTSPIRHFGYTSFLDSLTGLYNRAYVAERVQHLLKLKPAARVAVLFINLDCFGKINDVAGYELGDRVLRGIARRLAGLMNHDDLLGRICGDEFVVVVDKRGDASDIGEFALQILDLFSTPLEIAGREYHLGASIGIACSSGDTRDADTLIRNAGSAMRRAKESGRGRVQFFTEGLQDESQRRFRLEELLRHALAAGELRLVYQPIIDSASHQTVGAEALLRWTSSELGEVAPAEFIPVAEEAGLMASIGDWVLEQACAQAAQWRTSIAPRLPVSVNISPLQFNERLVRQVAACLERNGLDASALQLEITERVLMPDDPTVAATTAALASLGVTLALDDFGTGYASLSYLKRFALHNLKIDRSFVAGLPRDSDSIAITRALVAMAHACSMTVTAEGVETHEQATVLREMHCDMLQGYLFGRPASADKFAGPLLSASRANTRRAAL